MGFEDNSVYRLRYGHFDTVLTGQFEDARGRGYTFHDAIRLSKGLVGSLTFADSLAEGSVSAVRTDAGRYQVAQARQP
jgi:hypothetical protein